MYEGKNLYRGRCHGIRGVVYVRFGAPSCRWKVPQLCGYSFSQVCVASPSWIHTKLDRYRAAAGRHTYIQTCIPGVRYAFVNLGPAVSMLVVVLVWNLLRSSQFPQRFARTFTAVRFPYDHASPDNTYRHTEYTYVHHESRGKLKPPEFQRLNMGVTSPCSVRVSRIVLWVQSTK